VIKPFRLLKYLNGKVKRKKVEKAIRNNFGEPASKKLALQPAPLSFGH
jgi:hypothetical protein